MFSIHRRSLKITYPNMGGASAKRLLEEISSLGHSVFVITVYVHPNDSGKLLGIMEPQNDNG